MTDRIHLNYVRDAKKFPVGLVAFNIETPLPNTAEGILINPVAKYAVAAHDPKDAFEHKKFREVAEGRLLRSKTDCFELHLTGEWVFKDVYRAIMQDVMENDAVPNRIRRQLTAYQRQKALQKLKEEKEAKKSKEAIKIK